MNSFCKDRLGEANDEDSNVFVDKGVAFVEQAQVTVAKSKRILSFVRHSIAKAPI